MKLSSMEWRRHLANQSRSSLTIAKYCEKHGIPTSRWYYWRKRLIREGASFSPLVPVIVAETESSSQQRSFAIRFPSGFQLIFDDGVEPSCLVRIVSVLRDVAP